MIDDLYTPEEVATKLKVERRSVYRWLLSGKLRGLRAGDTWRIAEQDLMAFLQSRGPGPVAQPGTDADTVPGDTVVDVGPQHPDYAKWEAYFGLRAQAAKKPGRKPVKQGKSLKDAGRTARKATKEGRKTR
ncbi:MAG TPA: helix-turn-helix domain-containing protein [Bryobacteraceae bacterium]|nr:helix-turn-helix domain-containing protein [Bryobacteraceae bacterium]